MAETASTRATILIELLVSFLGRESKKLRRYSRLLAGDIQGATGTEIRPFAGSADGSSALSAERERVL